MKPKRVFACDFETTVYENQTYTAVWSAAMAELFTSEDALIFHSISEWWDYVTNIGEAVILYFHNLRFDGSFILWYFENVLHYKQAFSQNGEEWYELERKKVRDLKNGEYIYLISDMGQWYSINCKINGHLVEIRDSVKILPFTLEKMTNDFDVPHKKLDMKYSGFRYPGCEITEKERAYIKNDVLGLRECIEIMYKGGHTKMTIGSCCMAEFRRTLRCGEFDELFPRLDEIKLNESEYDSPDVDSYIRRAYRGGWCFLKPGRENQVFENGLTLDVNSLYPFVMSGESGNAYPVGKPVFWKGEMPPETEADNVFYYVRFSCRFRLKKGKLPCLQIKKNPFYTSNKWLETSAVTDADGKTSDIVDINGKLVAIEPVLTMAKPDFELFCENYDITNLRMLDGCYFRTEIGLFDKYLNFWRKEKETQKGAKRTIAKLFSNNLYGKFGTSPDSSYKIIEIDGETNALNFLSIPEKNKKPVFIAVGAAVTSYARSYIIRAAQENFDSFIYADTDSLHLNCGEDRIKGVELDGNKYGRFKIEKRWKKGIFIRQKTYLEFDEEFSVTAAGMPSRCKKFLSWSMSGKTPENSDEVRKEWENMSEEQRQFVLTKRTIEDFKVGLQVPGKLIPKQIPGGCVLKETYFTVRG